jgi:hypothetical protein
MLGGAGFMAGRAAARRAEEEEEQEERLAQLEQQAPPPVAGAPPRGAEAPKSDLVSKLKELKALHDEGVLSPDEFQVAKQKLLAS